MSSEKILFDEQLNSLQTLSSIYGFIKKSAPHMDADALLRAEYVLLVSSFDNYIHNIVRRKIGENFFASNPMPKDFSLPIEVFQLMRMDGTESGQKSLLDSYLNKLLAKDSFQSPKSIEYALGLIDISKIWTAAASTFCNTADNVKNELALIVQRRNQIAHEADVDITTGLPRAISIEVVSDCRNFLQLLVKSIDTQVI